MFTKDLIPNTLLQYASGGRMSVIETPNSFRTQYCTAFMLYIPL